MTFAELHLIEPLLRALSEEGYERPTPIQHQAVPHVLAGRDLLGCAQTGTGKTAAFALPILQNLHKTRGEHRGRPHVRVLVLSPTRELAAQIADSFTAYGRHLRIANTVIFGGVGQGNQEKALARGVEVLVATPGRLLDLMSQRVVSLDKVEVFVLDEADRMLDMGFIHDVRRVIAALPTRRQTLLFSATMPPDIEGLAAAILRDPVHVAVTPPATTVERIEQLIYFVEKNDKRLLLEHLLQDPSVTRALVFTRTKHGANRVAEFLEKRRIPALAIHGNKSQGARERALAGFKNGSTRVLVATDIAARGIDVDGVSHVINFELPNVPETYVHRIGRTARAGASGIALSLCELEEREYLADIHRLTGANIRPVEEHPYRSPHGTPSARSARGHAPRAAQPPARREQQPRPPRPRAPQQPQAPRDPQRAAGSGVPMVRRPAPGAPAGPQDGRIGRPRRSFRPRSSRPQ